MPKIGLMGWRVFVLCLLIPFLITGARAGPADASPLAGDAARPNSSPRPAPEVVTRRTEPRTGVDDLPQPMRFVTRHATQIRGNEIRYRAVAGETYIQNLYGQPTASIFSFSYLLDDPANRDRPVMFVFNGGPGSSSLWLHMGVVGPRRVVLDREVNPSNLPPFGYQDNPYSLLDVADLVFVDPVGTGFSRAVGSANEDAFFGVEEDADANARFVEAWLTEHGRWNSPKFLMGESYGATRVAVMTRALTGGPFFGGTLRGITVNGVVMVSPSLAVDPRPATDPLAQGLALPTLAVNALHHGRVAREAKTASQFYDDVKHFGIGEYRETLEKLAQGMLADKEKTRMAARLSELTGVPASEWASRDLKLSTGEFRRLLLSDLGLEVGAYDGRYTMPLAGSGHDPVADDPAMAKYTPAFVAAFQQMIRNELDIRMPRPYISISWAGANFGWRWNRPAGGAAATPVGDLAMSMRRASGMRLMVASGLYDFATTPAKAENDLADAKLPAARIVFRTYESGHMLYLGDTAEAFASDVRAFIEAR